MQNGSTGPGHTGRVEISDIATFDALHLRLSDDAIQEIRRLEECLMTAEQRLGAFRVG